MTSRLHAPHRNDARFRRDGMVQVAGGGKFRVGSRLCAPSYCRRDRPAARPAQPIDISTSHVGFRRVTRDAASS